MRLWHKLSIPIVLVTVLVTLVAAFVITDSLKRAFFKEDYEKVKSLLLREVRNHLSAEDFAHPTDPLSQEHFSFFTNVVRDTSAARFTIWSKDRVVLFSDLSSIIGYQSSDHAELNRLFETKTAFFVDKAEDNNKPVQSQVGEFMDTYIPIEFDGVLVGAIETQRVNAVIIKPIEKEIQSIIYLLWIGCVITLATIFFVLRYVVTRPLEVLGKAAQHIVRKEFDYPVTTTALDEIGELSRNFVEMRVLLKSLIGDLEKEIATEKILEAKMAGQTEDLQKFKLAIENTSQHVIITDTEGVILYANPAVSRMTGYGHEEIIGNRPSLWGKQMPREFYEKMWQTIKVDKRTFSGEIENKRKNGESYIAFATISPVVNAQGELRFFVGLESDVSLQKKLETALKEQVVETEKSKTAVLHLLEDIEKEKEKVDALVVLRTQELNEEKARLVSSINSIPFGFLIANNDGRILLMNGVIMELFHLDDTKTITIKDVARCLGETSDLTLAVEECMKGQRVCEIKEIIFGAKFLRGIIAPIATGGEGAKTIGYVLLFEDVTEARVLERSRDEFFSIASHELRTPLTAIRGNSEMIESLYKDKIVDADMSGMLSDIHEASVRLIDIVNDFLDVARLEQGNVAVDKMPFDIVAPIEQVFRDLRVPLEQKGLAFSFKKPYGLPLVSGDKRRLEQVVMNLLGNAIKFSTKGVIGVEIVVELEKNRLKILVSDTGMGISPENQTLLFHKFQQAGEKILARDVTQGTGLGLYISKLLIERMGGIMGLVKSTPGEGSTFYFTLPLA